jgi:hypothetical protein
MNFKTKSESCQLWGSLSLSLSRLTSSRVLVLLNLVIAGHEPDAGAGGVPPRPQSHQATQPPPRSNYPPPASSSSSAYSNPYETQQRGIAETKIQSNPYASRTAPSPYDSKPQQAASAYPSSNASAYPSSNSNWAPNNKPVARYDDAREAITPINALNPYSNRLELSLLSRLA